MTEKNNGVVREYYDEEKIKLSNTYYIFNGKREGENKSYHYDTDEQLGELYNYKNNKREGEYKFYWVDGRLHLILNYKDDLIII